PSASSCRGQCDRSSQRSHAASSAEILPYPWFLQIMLRYQSGTVLSHLTAKNLLCDGPAYRLIVVKFHREVRPPLRHAAQVGRVAEHLGERHKGRNRPPAARLHLHLLDVAAPCRDVALNRAHVLFRRHHLDPHDRLKQHRVALL